MFLNQIQKPNHKILFVDRFDGLCDEVVASQHSWRSMQNMSGSAYPSICTRKPYHVLRRVDVDTQVFSHDKLMLLQGDTLYEGTRSIGRIGKGKRCCASMGEDFIIMPDKLLYNAALGTLRPMEQRYRKRDIQFTITDAFGEPYKDYVVSDTPPGNHALWLDTREKKLKRYQNGVYESVQSIYICLEAPGIDEGFAVGDAVSISGIRALPELNQSYIIEGLQTNRLLVMGYLPHLFTESSEVEIARSVPTLDRMAVWNQRLWGFNAEKREVYASKLGNPCVFEAFSGLSGDSYLLSLDEEPLQLIAWEEELLIFCADCIYRITGNRPQNFRTVRMEQPGLRKGSEDSLQLLNGALYYLSSQGVMYYNGLFHRINKAALRNIGDCIAFTQGNRYYLCQQNGAEQGIFVYDSERAFWHKEENCCVSSACRHKGTAYFITNNALLSVGKPDKALEDGSMEQEGPLYWFAETADFSLTLPDKRNLDMIQVMLSGKGDYAIFVAFDVDPQETDNSKIPWKIVDADVFRGELAVRVPICAQPCHTMRLRISGNGSATIYSILRSIYEVYEE